MYFINEDSIYFDRTVKKDNEFKKVSAYNWQRSKSGLYDFGDSSVAALSKAEALHLYTMPRLPVEEIAATVKITVGGWKNHHSSVSYHIDFVEDAKDYILIKGWAYTNGMCMDFTDIFLWLLNEKESIQVAPYHERRYDLAVSNLTIQENCGFFAAIPKTELPQGNYKLGIEIQKRYIVPIWQSAKSVETDVDVRI